LTHHHQPPLSPSLPTVRTHRDTIYTFTGPILIAVNPFKPLPIYSDDTLATYRDAGQEAAARLAGQQSEEAGGEAPALPPHIYAVADAAYRAMTGPLSAAASPNQSILVSGESGAGKTESTKFIMQVRVDGRSGLV
jgi:myosin V